MKAKRPTEAHTALRRLRIELAVRTDIERFLRTAVHLAKLMDTRLEVIFRQDQDVLDAAALPFVHEVCLWTGEERLTSRSLLASSMRIQARQARKLLAGIAEREAVAYTFISEREGPAREASESQQGVLWVGGRSLSTRSKYCPVCALVDADQGDPESLQQAREFAARTGRSLKVYRLGQRSPGEQEANGDELSAEDFAAWLQRAGELPCFVLFLPRQFYSRLPELKTLHKAPFPVLLV